MSKTPDLVESVVRQLAAAVEPNTRFDRSSLPVAAAQTETFRVTGTHGYEVSFHIEHREEKGPLPAGVRDLGGRGALDSHEAAQLAAVRRQLPARLHDWLAGQTTLPGRELTSGDCYDRVPPAGFAYACETCHGRGKTSCNSCLGQGKITCHQCQGSGRANCGHCHGSGRIQCSGCNGSGQVTAWGERRVTNYADNTSYTERYSEQVTCGSCGGRRERSCGHCSSGKVQCSTCYAGKITCLACTGSGKVTCSQCAGSGSQHVVATLSCVVGQSLTLAAETPHEDAKKTMTSLDSLEKLCELTPVELRHASAADHSITRQFETMMPLAMVTVRAAEQVIEILGYGDAARVFDFKNIVGALLQHDLDDLEQVLQSAPRFPLRPMHALDDSLRQFLASEINARIGSVASTKRPALQALATNDLHGAVSEEYVVHAVKAVRQATSRVFRSEMSVPALVAAIIPALLLAIIPLLHPHWRSDSGWVAMWSLPVVGFVAERFALARYRERFDAELARRAVALLKAKRTLWWWRLTIFLAAIVTAFGYFAILVPI